MAESFDENLILHERVAAGGMGEIFRATQTGAGSFSKTVAVKRILAGLSQDEMFVKMFVRETSISSRLHHPNILQVYRSGQTDDGLYLVMEFVDGQSIERLLRKLTARGLFAPPSLCCLVMAEAAKGLHFAHSLTDPATGEPTPVVHRDISPSNVMVSYNGEVKLIDFGFAKIANMSSLTVVGELKGKAAYFAPEVIAGGEAAALSDLFSLGVTFFELVSGSPLFHADTPMQAMAKIEKCEIPPLARYRTDCSPQLERIIRLLLEKDPKQRLRSANDLHRLLAQLLADEYAGTLTSDLGDFMKTIFSDEIRELKALRANPTSVPISASRPRRRAKIVKLQRYGLLALLVVNLMLLLFSAAPGWFGQRSRASSSFDQAAAAEIAALPGLAGWFRAEPSLGSNDAPVVRWNDLSSNHHDLLQVNVDRQPRIRCSPGTQRCTMLFDGKSNFMEGNSIAEALRGSKAATFFYVARSFGGGAAQYVFSVHGGDRRTDVLRAGFSPGGSTARLKADTLRESYLESDPILPQELGCFRAIFGESSVSLDENGERILSASGTTPIPFGTAETFSVGQEWDGIDRPTDFLHGDVSELLIFDRLLSDSESAQVQSYLDRSYGCGAPTRPNR